MSDVWVGLMYASGGAMLALICEDVAIRIWARRTRMLRPDDEFIMVPLDSTTVPNAEKKKPGVYVARRSTSIFTTHASDE